MSLKHICGVYPCMVNVVCLKRICGVYPCMVNVMSLKRILRCLSLYVK